MQFRVRKRKYSKQLMKKRRRGHWTNFGHGHSLIDKCTNLHLWSSENRVTVTCGLPSGQDLALCILWSVDFVPRLACDGNWNTPQGIQYCQKILSCQRRNRIDRQLPAACRTLVSFSTALSQPERSFLNSRATVALVLSCCTTSAAFSDSK